jgi:acyl CoA:acetate/3-ketoacid CoA transferase alpha subunit
VVPDKSTLTTGPTGREPTQRGHRDFQDERRAAAAVADIPDGATIMIGEFGRAGVGTELALGKESRTIDGRDYVLE